MADKDKNGSRVGGPFRFRVSDSFVVPLRGQMLRLKLVEGSPSMKDLSKGRRLRVMSPAGEERTVRISGHGATAGRASQDRLVRTRELDVVIAGEDAGEGRARIGIGWFATGPAS